MLFRSATFEQKTAKETLAFAKANPQKLTMAIAGTGSVVVDLFKARSGLDFMSVPYKGSSPALIDLISGQVNVMITTMASAGTHVKSGKLRALAVTGQKRNSDFADIPTFTELGIQGMDYEQWFGMLAPARLPQKVGAILGASIAEAIKDAEVRDRFNRLALDPAFLGPEDYNKRVLSDAARWRKVAADAGIKPVE